MFNEMMDEVIRRFGFESRKTVTFCILCEQAEKGVISETSVIKRFEELI